MPTVRRIADQFSVDLHGNASDQSVGRIVMEGLVGAKHQFVHEAKQAEGATFSSNGTSHKHLGYMSRHCKLILADRVVTRFMGITGETSHTSEAQLDGWVNLIKEIYETYNRATSTGEPADWRDLLAVLKGMNTDHAEDQKKLGEQRGEKILAARGGTTGDSKAGGSEIWNGLKKEQQSELNQVAYLEVCVRVGREALTELSDAEKSVIDFFTWVGCCMHKGMNSVKGSTAAMAKYWKDNKLTGPIKLMNKDNKAATQLGQSAAADRVVEMSQGGAVKLTSLAGAAFNHKDDKKGQHDTLKAYCVLQLGYSIDFPDTSNTRYQFHCRACDELLINRRLYLDFLDNVRDKKRLGPGQILS
ncbi:hypothetical protein C8J56DRAFT_1060765 [Mycena floridula]|nr:hypothetical protein C8J56DRAFT_1060765 [Mycena floridula]